MKLEWADYPTAQAQCGNLSGNKLTRNLSGNTRPQSSQLTEPLWTDPGLKSGIFVRELIFTKKKKKKRWRGMNSQTFSPLPKRHPHHNWTLLGDVINSLRKKYT